MINNGEDITRLTPRQSELIGCLAEGMQLKQAAHYLGIAEQTAKNHMYQARIFCGIPSQTRMIALFSAEQVRNKIIRDMNK